MAVIEGRTWLELLTPTQCWDELRQAEVGRVAVLVDGRPEIYPVNFVVDDETIVFRTDPGGKLYGLLQHPATSFEVDGLDPTQRTGWSVLVKGSASEIRGGPEMSQATALDLRFWAHGEKSRWLRIRPDEVTGRRIHRPAGRSVRRG
jgi:nitroimidazol reductase NimA-like FMN-containing flavoprotein (pyridoxamine 5'-phosphate oxidase superfamily)